MMAVGASFLHSRVCQAAGKRVRYEDLPLLSTKAMFVFKLNFHHAAKVEVLSFCRTFLVQLHGMMEITACSL